MPRYGRYGRHVESCTPDRAFVATVYQVDRFQLTTTIHARNPTIAEDVERYNAQHRDHPAERIVIHSELPR